MANFDLLCIKIVGRHTIPLMRVLASLTFYICINIACILLVFDSDIEPCFFSLQLFTVSNLKKNKNPLMLVSVAK